MRPAAPPKTRQDKFPDTIPYSLPLELVVTDPEIIAELWAKREGRERDDYALGALRLGMLALRQLRGQIDAVAAPAAGQDEPHVDRVPPAPSRASEVVLIEGAEEHLDAEPAAEELFEEPVTAACDLPAVSSSYWLRRRRRGHFR
jgi:hypothetical protein